ncbi:MAG: hypothetical protein M1838_001828 [Thelocarpon superellum]|nr:MAG: hypothetical protein M1838_001828 [Thelocarpon superellum]
MSRRIVRTGVQLGLVAALTILIIFVLDNRFRVLPQSIHDHLPMHHPGLVVIDISVATCSSLSLFSTCRLDPEKWSRVEKDLYLNSGWMSNAYIHVQRKKEEELLPEDKVVLDVRVGRQDPTASAMREGEHRWESRPAGIWLQRTAKRHASDSEKAITAIDVLFGADAVEPRQHWEIRDTPLLLDTSGEKQEARLSVRRGPPAKLEKPVPRIRKDGKFKIMQVADLHLSTGFGSCRDPVPTMRNGMTCDADPRTLEFVGTIMDQEKPDLVVLTGDQVNGETSPDAQSAIFKYAELFIKRKIPYVTIFGNHDDEGSLSRAASMELVESLPYSLSEAGHSTVDGVGNYYVEVLARGTSHHSALTLYLLDTHSYSPDEDKYKGYDWLKPSQIDWFKETAQGLKKAHEAYTHFHMDMAFIHIPLPEYRKTDNQIVGGWKEGPTAPGYNSGFRDALVQQGVLFVSCGQYVPRRRLLAFSSLTLSSASSDHVNDYCSLETDGSKPALWMCYGGGSGFGGYGGYGGYLRRLRFFDIDTNEARITTYKRLEPGQSEDRIDEQIIVDSGRVVAA